MYRHDEALLETKRLLNKLSSGGGSFDSVELKAIKAWVKQQLETESREGIGTFEEQLEYFQFLRRIAKQWGRKSLAQYALTKWSKRTKNPFGIAYGQGYEIGHNLGGHYATKRSIIKLEKTISDRARKAVLVHHSDGIKAKAKRQVRDRFDSWVLQPERYPSAAAFARDMLEKHPPEVLGSQEVIQRWVRAWRKES